MTDERRFDDLLREDAAALPPPAAGEINPWSMAMTRVLWGLGLITITLNFLYLDVILPAVGGLLLVLGFCTLRRENTPLRWCYILSLASLAVRGACIVLAALPVETGLAPAYVNIALLQVLYVCLWRGMVGVSRAAGEEKPAATAAGASGIQASARASAAPDRAIRHSPPRLPPFCSTHSVGAAASRGKNAALPISHGLFHTGESVLVSGPGNFSCNAQSRIAAARAAWNASTYGRSFFIRSPRGSICAAP